MFGFNTNDIVIVVILIFVAILWLVLMFKFVANNWIKKNRKQLFGNNKPLTNECEKLGIEILNKEVQYDANINDMGLNRTYKCSGSIVANAKNNPVKYLLKYSDLEYEVRYLEELEFCINFLDMQNEFIDKMENLCEKAKQELPLHIKVFVSKEKLPFLICNIPLKAKNRKSYAFEFLYVSPAGKSRSEYKVDISNVILKKIEIEMENKLKKKGHIKAQRNAMTADLREAVKQRDNYTCQMCGNSVYKEPNLLLEVDHIIPISKGGKTEAGNLQTLCWRCNRKKGNR